MFSFTFKKKKKYKVPTAVPTKPIFQRALHARRKMGTTVPVLKNPSTTAGIV